MMDDTSCCVREMIPNTGTAYNKEHRAATTFTLHFRLASKYTEICQDLLTRSSKTKNLQCIIVLNQKSLISRQICFCTVCTNLSPLSEEVCL